MQHVVYCDESRHSGGPGHHFMAIGSLWLPREQKLGLTRRVRELFRAEQLNAEVKWSKVTRSRLDSYKRVIDLFFQEPELRFRVIIVEMGRLNQEKFNSGDAELGFYKFYYELLVQWLKPGDEYLILLDFKQNQNPRRYHDLRLVLSRKLKGSARISDLTVIDSAETPLAQLCDLLTGALAATWCADLPEGSAKADLIGYIAEKRRAPYPKFANPTPALSKFNVFRIDLQ